MGKKWALFESDSFGVFVFFFLCVENNLQGRGSLLEVEKADLQLLRVLLLKVVGRRQGEEGVRMLVQSRVVCVVRVEVEWLELENKER